MILWRSEEPDQAEELGLSTRQEAEQPARMEFPVHETQPLVSVVIPCHNYSAYLGDAIESVLRQSYQPLEVLVVDDGSTDRTRVVSGRYPRVKYFYLDHDGLAAARNHGLAHSRGEYIVFLDADDCLLPGALQTGVERLAENPAAVCATGRCRCITIGSPKEPLIQPTLSCLGYVELLRRNHIWNPGSVIYRRRILNQVGAFNPDMSPAADFELYLRLSRRYPICTHDAIVVEYRLHSENMSRSATLMLEAIVAAYRLQLPHLGSREVREAWTEGVQAALTYYEPGVLKELKEAVVAREWKAVQKSLRLLCRYRLRALITCCAGRLGRILVGESKEVPPQAAKP